MYESYFGLKEAPFSIAPNPHYLYMSNQHNEALAHLIYGVEREGGFILLTGEVGTGKTTICRCFLEQIPENTDVAFILNPKLNSEQLLETICDELSIGYIGDSLSIKDYTDYINERLLRSHGKGRHTVLIIDEAQNLSAPVLEQLRLLTNLETHEKKLLQIILLGQPELQDMFLRPELRQLSQRVTARFHLDALTKEEITPYVYHRLSVAGCVNPELLFGEKTIHKLYNISKGIPRVINLVCDRALLGAYAENRKNIDVGLLQLAAKEVLGKSLILHKENRFASLTNGFKANNWMSVLGLCVACLTLGIVLATMFGKQSVPVSEPGYSSDVDLPPASLNRMAMKNNVNVATNLLDDPIPVKGGDINSPQGSLAASSGNDFKKLGQLLGAQYDLSKRAAYVNLMRAWGINYLPASDGFACKYAAANGVNCLSKIGSIGTVSHLGLPAALTLFDAEGEKHFLVVRKVSDDKVLFAIGASQIEMSLTELNRHWRGHFVVLWRKPPHYVAPLLPGSIAPMTKWLGKQLDVYDGVSNPSLGRSFYDDALVARVKSFQQKVGEQPDGIAGVNTLILLSRLTDQTIPTLYVDKEAL